MSRGLPIVSLCIALLALAFALVPRGDVVVLDDTQKEQYQAIRREDRGAARERRGEPDQQR